MARVTHPHDDPHDDSVEATLAEGLEQIGVALSEAKVSALTAYLALLQTWNRAFNLTAVRNPRDMVYRHLLESLMVLPYVRGPRLLDVGTGAGLPGLVLAVACPQLQCVLLDKNAKKTRFCLQVTAELGLHNVEVVRVRAEEYRPGALFSTVVARAFGPLLELLMLARHRLMPGGHLIAMKGVHPQSELDDLPATCPPPRVIPLRVPGISLPRHLIILNPETVPAVDTA
ncbi:MAG: 16S rRNA (guanine(527)-N(7))-methyltransferase RsmG [Gammaproteobacteria bacterium]